MGPTTVTGGDAVRAWRALTAQQHAVAWAAAQAGAAPPDGALAAVMAGYGLRRQRQLQFAPLGIVVVFPVVFCGALLGMNAAGAGDAANAALGIPFLFGVIALILTGSWLRARFGRLAAAGALGLDAARRGAVPAGVPVPLASEGDFTVPYGVPQAPAYTAPAQPVFPDAAGVVEVPAQRGRVVILLAVLCPVLFLVLAGLVASFFALAGRGHDPVEWVFLVIEAAAMLTLVGSLGLIIVLLVPVLRSPVTARFTPAGWELPAGQLRGTWAEVQAIEVRAASTARGTPAYGQSNLPALRFVVLRVPQPERYLADAGPVLRWSRTRAIKRYGSPVLLVVGPRTPVNLEQLLATLAQYTAAPVRWT